MSHLIAAGSQAMLLAQKVRGQQHWSNRFIMQHSASGEGEIEKERRGEGEVPGMSQCGIQGMYVWNVQLRGGALSHIKTIVCSVSCPGRRGNDY